MTLPKEIRTFATELRRVECASNDRDGHCHDAINSLRRFVEECDCLLKEIRKSPALTGYTEHVLEHWMAQIHRERKAALKFAEACGYDLEKGERNP